MTDVSGQPIPQLTRREAVRLIGGSLIRTTLGLFVIWAALAILPVNPDRTILLPFGVALLGTFGYIWFFRGQLRRVRKSRYPSIAAVEALILVAAMFLAVFSVFYVLISAQDPTAFTEPLNHFTAYYFALTVLATVGFGDITPVSDVARLVAMVQMALDLAFLATAVKIMTSAAQDARRRTQARSADEPDDAESAASD